MIYCVYVEFSIGTMQLLHLRDALFGERVTPIQGNITLERFTALFCVVLSEKFPVLRLTVKSDRRATQVSTR